ncbi:NADH-cytochrome b5 reductase-like [Topomyia yanbarensis]|uniref:NADH-cytochrome b5 reductase-like n=1 Tax=Topomyia yanbarensis TaxID=2498891 RepID=UPI00273B8160|nr:NADH-cytochrome b5 reductase-like [Topomyia yanbarensis]
METVEVLPECCGSGCTNCVLDHKIKPQNSVTNLDGPSVLNTGHYRLFECILIDQCTENTFLFRFQLKIGAEDQQKQLIITPGSHLVLRVPKHWRNDGRQFSGTFSKWRKLMAQFEPEARVQPKTIEKYDKTELDLYISRPYTPIRVNREEKSFDVLIKLEPGGEMSEYLTTLNIGEATEWKGAYTGLYWKRNMRKYLFGFAQGVGLAPIYSIMANILEDEEDETLLKLCYCCKDIDSILLRADLQTFGYFWNFDPVIYLSRETCSCGSGTATNCTCLSSKKKYTERIFNHRLEKLDVQNLLRKIAQNSLQVLICGNTSFTELIEASITELNIENYYKF